MAGVSDAIKAEIREALISDKGNACPIGIRLAWCVLCGLTVAFLFVTHVHSHCLAYPAG